MFIQGDLQAIFDALYNIGALDPVLKADWIEIQKEMALRPQEVAMALQVVNSCDGQAEQMVEAFSKMEPQLLKFVAMEVAREFVEFQDRAQIH